MSVSIRSRINGVDDCLGSSSFCSTEESLGCGDILVEVNLLEGHLGAVPWLGSSDLLDGESGIERWHVKNVCLGGGLNQSLLSSWVGKPTSSTRADEEWSGEVVSQDGGTANMLINGYFYCRKDHTARLTRCW